MCQFCAQHGDGKVWYLEASNYAFDLEADLRRREYVLHFIQTFDEAAGGVLHKLDLASRLPRSIQHLGKAYFSRRMQDIHFGQPVPIEECEAIFDITTSITRIPCPCRSFAGTRDEGYCLLVTTRPYDGLAEEAFRDYDTGPDLAKFEQLTKEEALALLRRCEEQGLMHSVWTFLTPFTAAICNCDLASGCMAMTLTLTHETPMMFKGHAVARADAEACSGCRACVQRCPFSALSIEARTKRALVDEDACYGCGVCRSACRYGALALVARERSSKATDDRLEPLANRS